MKVKTDQNGIGGNPPLLTIDSSGNPVIDREVEVTGPVWQFLSEYYNRRKKTAEWHDGSTTVFKTFESYSKYWAERKTKTRQVYITLSDEQPAVEGKHVYKSIPDQMSDEFGAYLDKMGLVAANSEKESVKGGDMVSLEAVEGIINKKLAELKESSLIFDNIEQIRFPNAFKPIISTLENILTQIRNLIGRE